MDFLRPASWEEALAAKAEHPTAVPIAGGTDVMVEINFDHRRPEYLLDLNRIELLRDWEVGERTSGWAPPSRDTSIMEHLRAELPGLALASHTVASPQIRNRGGVGGNLGTASAVRRPPRLLARGRRGGGRVGPRQPLHPDRRVLHRRQAQRPAARRADQDRPHRARPAARSSTPRWVPATPWSSPSAPSASPSTRRPAPCAPGSAPPRPPPSAKEAEEFLNAALEEGGFWDNGKIITPSVAKQFADLASAAC